MVRGAADGGSLGVDDRQLAEFGCGDTVVRSVSHSRVHGPLGWPGYLCVWFERDLEHSGVSGMGAVHTVYSNCGAGASSCTRACGLCLSARHAVVADRVDFPADFSIGGLGHHYLP